MSRERGFTLVEVLVVIAVIGILIAFLLPAVQQAREAARRMSCKNNLHQVGIALHSYHDIYRAFPPGSVNEWSWNARILPQLEQNVAYEQFDFKFEPFEPPNFNRLDLVLPLLLCPSDPYGEQVYTANDLGGMRFAHTNYVGSLDSGLDRGLFGFGDGVRLADVGDGTSQTLCVGERGVVFDGSQTHGWWTWGSSTTVTTHQEFRIGSYDEPDSVYHWWSYHPGGALFLLVDGSVHFLPYTINPDTFAALTTRDGGEVAGAF